MSEPAAVQKPERVGELQRLGVLLLVFFVLHLASMVGDRVTDSSHSYSIDLSSLILGCLLLNGSLGAARVLAFVTSFQLANIPAAICVGTLLITALARREFAMIWAQLHMPISAILWAVAVIAIEAAISLYFLRELRKPEVEDALVRAGKRPMRGPIRWGAGFAIGGWLFLALVAILVAPMFRQAAETVSTLAKAKAATVLGEGWTCSTTGFKSSDDHWEAHLVCHNGEQERELDLSSDSP